MDLKSVLESYGFQPKPDGPSHYRMAAHFRAGNNRTAIRINRKTGGWTDFVTNDGGNFRKLLALTLGRKSLSDEDYQKIVQENEIELEEEEREEIVMEKKWSKDELYKLVPNYQYFIGRGISKETQQAFHCGFAESGAMSGRQVFPVFLGEDIIGWHGRAVFKDKSGNEPQNKWKKIGPSNVVYPVFLPSLTAKKRTVYPVYEAIKEKGEVIIVESIGDAMSLYEKGIKNIIVTFGTRLSSKVCAFIASQDIKKVIIATNNDIKSDGGENVGQRFAIDCFIQLSAILSYNKIIIHLPQTANDFGDIMKEGRGDDIIRWYNTAPQENTVDTKLKILHRMRELYKEGKLSTAAVKMAKEIKEDIEESSLQSLKKDGRDNG